MATAKRTRAKFAKKKMYSDTVLVVIKTEMAFTTSAIVAKQMASLGCSRVTVVQCATWTLMGSQKVALSTIRMGIASMTAASIHATTTATAPEMPSTNAA